MRSFVSFLKSYRLVAALSVAILTSTMHAQVAPAGKAGSGGLDVFAMYNFNHPDLIYSPDHGMAYGAELKTHSFFGVQPGIVARGANDFNWKYIQWGIYSFGPAVHFMPAHRLSPYADVLFGVGHAQLRSTQFYNGTANGRDIQIGAGATYRLTPRVSAIGDYQHYSIDLGRHNGRDLSYAPWSLSFGLQFRIF